MKVLFCGILALILTGCASLEATGAKFVRQMPAGENKGLVYLFKPDPASKDFVTTCLTFTLNDVEYGCVKGKGYVFANVSAGTYKGALVNKASFGYKLLEFDLVVKAGETVFLEYAFGRSLNGSTLANKSANYSNSLIVFSGKHFLASVSEDEGLKKLNDLNYSD